MTDINTDNTQDLREQIEVLKLQKELAQLQAEVNGPTVEEQRQQREANGEIVRRPADNVDLADAQRARILNGSAPQGNTPAQVAERRAQIARLPQQQVINVNGLKDNANGSDCALAVIAGLFTAGPLGSLFSLMAMKGSRGHSFTWFMWSFIGIPSAIAIQLAALAAITGAAVNAEEINHTQFTNAAAIERIAE